MEDNLNQQPAVEGIQHENNCQIQFGNLPLWNPKKSTLKPFVSNSVGYIVEQDVKCLLLWE